MNRIVFATAVDKQQFISGLFRAKCAAQLRKSHRLNRRKGRFGLCHKAARGYVSFFLPFRMLPCHVEYMFTAFIDFPFPANCRFRTKIHTKLHAESWATKQTAVQKENGEEENFCYTLECNFIWTGNPWRELLFVFFFFIVLTKRF